jgi:Xaa-Pro aminopeptidase
VFDLTVWQEDENPVRLIARDISRQVIDRGASNRPTSIAVSDQMWSVFLLRLQAVIDEANWQSAGQVIEPLRIIKSAAEIAALAEIGAAADIVFSEIVKERFSGRREVDIAALLGQMLQARGHEIAKFAIVGSGPNGASPHHDAGARVITPGDFVVLDFGGPGHEGYGSDISRTVFVAGDAGLTPTAEQQNVYNTVKEAQELAFQAIRPGIEAQALDKVARDHITAAGYGDAFLHRLGHGIGLDGHETPYLVHGNATKIEPGMAFSDEPGIYLAGKFGVRIEDIVYCTESGGVRCNEASRELVMVR